MKHIDIPTWFHRIGITIVVISSLRGIRDGSLEPFAIGLVFLTVLAFVAVLLQNAAKRREQ